MRPEDRRERILALIHESTKKVSVEELAQMLDISRETIRRDLTLLADQGIIRKIHGGAVPAQTALESPLGERRAMARTEKIAIARAAAALFEPGDSLMIDSGSTTTFFAEALGKIGSFTVITNSTLVAAELWNAEQRSDVYLLGGRFFGEGYETLGPVALEQIQGLYADHAVLTIGALDPAGHFMDYNADEAYLARAMMANARTITVLADSAKVGRHALFQVCAAKEVHRLVTDRMPEPGLASLLTGAGVEIIIA